MRKTGLISSNNSVPSTKDMQVLDEQTKRTLVNFRWILIIR